MKLAKLVTLALSLQMLFISSTFAGDFAWLEDLNIAAKADSSGFRVKLATRFRIGDAEVKAVISNVNHRSDAYMIFRLGELSHRHHDDVLKVYRKHSGQGWGVMAKKLGIKPGSAEFHALKRGHDLNYSKVASHKKSSAKHNGKSQAKNKDHKKGKGKHF